MRILLAGATGAIGRPLVPMLVAAGHEIVALTRSSGKVAGLNAAGARGVACDVTDRDALLALAAEVEPDVVLDETTDLPQRYDSVRMKGFYDAMVALRTQGTPNLVEAAERTGARIVLQGIAFAYAPDGTARLRTEEDRVFGTDGPPPWDVAMPIVTRNELRAVEAGGLVLRYGQFYGPGTHWAPGGETYESVRRRRFPIPGKGTGVFSFIHVEDAAAATVAALEAGATGILNVVDDTPVTLAEWLPEFARAIGAPRPLRVPLPVARLVTSPLPVHMATTLPGASNAKARATLGWAPRYPSFAAGLRASDSRDARREYTT